MSETSGPAQDTIGNGLLRRLGPEDYAALRPHLTRVQLPLGTHLARSGEAIAVACFPEAGVVGLLQVLPDGRRLAVGLTGQEGLVGWPLLLGNDRWPHDAVMRAEDASAVRIEAGALSAAVERRASLRHLLLRFTGSVVAQMADTVASNLIHPVEARTARWLLLYHDRVRGDEVPLTHEELGLMLGVRRSSITDALHVLEGQGAIRGHRGRIVIRDRQHLRTLAANTYGTAEEEYRRLVRGPVPH